MSVARGGVGQRRSLWPDVTPPQGVVCSLFHGRILHQTCAPKKPNLIRALIFQGADFGTKVLNCAHGDGCRRKCRFNVQTYLSKPAAGAVILKPSGGSVSSHVIERRLGSFP